MPRLSFHHSRIALVCASAFLALAMQAAHAQTAGRSKAVTFSIANQSLDSALSALSAATGVPIVFAPALVAGKTAPAVKGSLTMRQALDQLLAGSGLAASEQSSGSIVIKIASSDGVTTFSDMTVTADQENPYGPVYGYIAKQSATATKTDTPIIETPQQISVVGAEQIAVMKPQNLTEALNYVAGVGWQEGFDRTADGMILRGFYVFPETGNYYRDGSKYTLNGNNGQQEPYGLERIEVLKGASSVLYGVAAPGGIVNTVTKRPTTTPIRELNVQGGSFHRKQVSGDFSDSFSNESDWSYRLTFLHRNSDTFVDYIKDNRTYIAPALKWQPNAATSLTLLGEYQRDYTQYIYGLPTVGTVYPNINGKIPRGLFVGEKSDKTDSYKVNRKSLGYIFEHEFNENTRLRHSLRTMRADTRRAFTVISTRDLSPDQRGTRDNYRLSTGKVENADMVTSDTSIQYKWQTGSVQNTTLIGLDYTYQNFKIDDTTRAVAGSFDYFSPVYGMPVSNVLESDYRQEKSNRLGVYLQHQAKILEKWVALLNLRQDWSRDTLLDFGSIEKKQQNSHALTGRAGLLYLAQNGLAPYFSYSQSFEPVIGMDRNGSQFKPTEGEQYELGVRYQPPGQDVLLSAAIYDLTQKNISVTDPVDSRFSVQQGKVRSRGFELEAHAKLWKDTNLIAAYTYTDARTLKSSPLTPDQNGKRTGGVPYNQFSVWIDHSFGSIDLPGLKAGVGARFVGPTKGAYITADVPAYTVFDAMVSYTVDSWRFALNASNLTDKTYIASCTYGCFYGEARNIIGTVTYRW